MKIRNLTAIILLLLTLTGCTATVKADPAASGGKTASAAGALIGEEQATSIALGHADLTEADVTRLRVEYEIDDGVKQYDVEFYHNSYEYEYEINAETGDIISADKDRED